MKFSTSTKLFLVAGAFASNNLALAIGLRGRDLEDPIDFPFIAITENEGRTCAGSLVYKDVVLTAAHCMTHFKKGIRIGSTNLKDPQNGELRQIVGRLTHESYDGMTGANDIMLLKLDKPATVEPVEWERSADKPSDHGELLSFAGYGAIVGGGFGKNPRLQSEQVETGDSAFCSSHCKGSLDFDEMFCTVETKTDFFYLNSGAPIINDDKVLVGIKAWGGECSGEKNVYTRVGMFGDWIAAGVCHLSNDPPSSHCKPQGSTTPLASSTCIDSTALVALDANTQGTCEKFASSGDYEYLCAESVDTALACPKTCKTCESQKTVTDDKCAENQPGTVDMGQMIGGKDCEWLEHLLDLTRHIAHVCEGTEVAFHCPRACNTCDKVAVSSSENVGS